MKIIFITTRFQENFYIYYDESVGVGVAIDPGEYSEKIFQLIQRHKIRIQAVLLTHGHYDHIDGVAGFCKDFKVKVYAHPFEKPLLSNPEANLSKIMGERSVIIEPDVWIKDQEALQFEGISLKVIHTPGHSPGGVCFYGDAEQTLFSGDTLFRGTIGRSDFAYGEESMLKRSIRNQLMHLPDTVCVYPGHGESTTIGYERRNNLYMKDLEMF